MITYLEVVMFYKFLRFDFDFFKKISKSAKKENQSMNLRLELEEGIVLGILKKKLLKTSNTVLMHSNSPARHFFPCFMLNVCYQG